MSNRTKVAAASKNIVFVPLNKLKKSPKNVRKVPHTKADIQAFAASIAALGMLQYPIVEPELGPRGKPTGSYLVNAGEGRRLAQLLRVKRKEIRPDEPIRCILDTEHSATEISLAENAVRSDMHPADQYEAFAKLHSEEGMSAEDIAARFGVTAAVVKQRLKLGAVSPKLRALYRKGDMNLDQLSAFAITEDHERQERVWAELPTFNRSREAILRALSEGQVRSDEVCALVELRSAPEEPFAAATSIFRIKALPAKSLAEQIGVRRIGETEDAVGGVVAAYHVPAGAKRKPAAEFVRDEIALAEHLIGGKSDLVRPGRARRCRIGP